MASPKGYRVDRLRRRQRGKTERWQAWVLYVLAGVVAFVSVLGAWYIGGRWLKGGKEGRPPGYIALLKLTEAQSGRPLASALAVKSAGDGYSLFAIPPELLLEGPNGEYVFAADAMDAGTLTEDLQRVIGARIDAVYEVSASTVAGLSGTGELQLPLADPVTLQVGGFERTFDDQTAVAVRDVPELVTAAARGGEAGAAVMPALWSAILQDAALRPVEERAASARSAAALASGASDTWYLGDALRGLSSGAATVGSVPSAPRVAEGQLAYVPDPEGIMAEITRRAPGYRSRFTVLVRNGSGAVGVGQEVARRLAVLDVNLPPVGNADSFDYRKTQILAGRRAVPVAQEVRAILGRGVVLDGPDLPPETVVVIVGKDLRVPDSDEKDQP